MVGLCCELLLNSVVLFWPSQKVVSGTVDGGAAGTPSSVLVRNSSYGVVVFGFCLFQAWMGSFGRRQRYVSVFGGKVFGAAPVALGLGGFGGGVPPTGYWFCLDFVQQVLDEWVAPAFRSFQRFLFVPAVFLLLRRCLGVMVSSLQWWLLF
ncbi:hypothetical protein A2U01_0024121, partial [Trifolium medium]|nr:hypothetical protein [Trifolium medium]